MAFGTRRGWLGDVSAGSRAVLQEQGHAPTALRFWSPFVELR